MTGEAHKHNLLRRLANPRLIILCICLVNLLFMIARVRRMERDFNPGPNDYIVGWDPTVILIEPIILLVASVGLLVNRWWSLLIAVLASGRIVYALGYLSWRAVHFAHDVPMFSRAALEKLWYVIYKPRPEYLVDVAVGLVILVYAVILLLRSAYAKARPALTGG
jgi:hypothetical protein